MSKFKFNFNFKILIQFHFQNSFSKFNFKILIQIQFQNLNSISNSISLAEICHHYRNNGDSQRYKVNECCYNYKCYPQPQSFIIYTSREREPNYYNRVQYQ